MSRRSTTEGFISRTEAQESRKGSRPHYDTENHPCQPDYFQVNPTYNGIAK